MAFDIMALACPGTFDNERLLRTLGHWETLNLIAPVAGWFNTAQTPPLQTEHLTKMTTWA